LIPSIITFALKMDTACFSEMLATTEQSERHQNPEELHHYRQRPENLKSHSKFLDPRTN
jgi:hypothetical protein